MRNAGKQEGRNKEIATGAFLRFLLSCIPKFISWETIPQNLRTLERRFVCDRSSQGHSVTRRAFVAPFNSGNRSGAGRPVTEWPDNANP
jgi:hypothetical protein